MSRSFPEARPPGHDVHMTTPPRTPGTVASPPTADSGSTSRDQNGRFRPATPAPAPEPGDPARGTEPPAPDDLPEDRFLNRELSWLDFNARVLARPEDQGTRLLERVK